MDRLFKKKLVALLLFVGCLLCGWLLLAASSAPEKKLTRFAQVDSLIRATLNEYSNYEQQISHSITQVDSTFKRKTFTVTVPVSFPETKLHLDLKHAFGPYGISVPAGVFFPEKDLRIQFYYKDTVIRTLIIDVEEPPDTVLSSLFYLNPAINAGLSS